MPKTKISEWSSTPANNTDIDSINIAEGCAPSGINDAIRELMAQVKDLYSGTTGDAIGVAGGGTGQTSYTNGQLLIGNTTGNTLTKATLTAGSGVSITNSTGSITIAATGAASQWTTTGSDIYYNTGNVAVGSAPKTYSLGKAIEVGFAGNGINGASQTQVSFIGNAYYNGNWKYGGTGKAGFMQIDAGVILWYNTDTSGTADNNITGFAERARIPTTGGFQSATTISVGNATPSTSGAGITFPASQSASSNANTLDDYEEGTFTPTDVSGASLSLTNTSGIYTKIGNLVTMVFRADYPSTASSITAYMSLPFAPISGATYASGALWTNNATAKTASAVDVGYARTCFLAANTITTLLNSQLSGSAMAGSLTFQTS
jgi:hypothetical protein